MRQYELVERVTKYDPDADEDLLNRAYIYAMKAHGSQTRASGEAYFNHPVEVAAILAEMRLDTATIVAALLHDTVEDTEATHQEIHDKFGAEIASLVDGLTKIAKLDMVTKEATQAENLRKLLLAMSRDVRVLLVKLADRLHNMRTLHFVKPEKRLRIAQETMEIYAPLAGRMGMQLIRDEMEDISFGVLNPDAQKIILDRLQRLHTESGDILQEIERALSKELLANGIHAEFLQEQKLPQISSVGHSRTERRDVVMNANAFQDHFFTVQQKSLILVESNRADAERLGCRVENFIARQHGGFQRVKVGSFG